MLPRYPKKVNRLNNLIKPKKEEPIVQPIESNVIKTTREAFLKNKKIQKDFEEGNFTEIDFFLKYSGKEALNYALEWTAFHGQIELVKQTINAGANIHADNDVALQMACENGHLNIVIYLISIGARINAANSSPLLRAIDGKHADIVKYLLEYKINNNRICDLHAEHDNALRTAVTNGQYDIVKLLIENGADINVLDQYVLKSAAGYGYYDIVKLLIESGIDASAIPEAIEYAKKSKHDVIVTYLESISNNTN